MVIGVGGGSGGRKVLKVLSAHDLGKELVKKERMEGWREGGKKEERNDLGFQRMEM